MSTDRWPDTRPDQRRSAAVAAIAVLLAAAVVLAVLVLEAMHDGPTTHAEVDEIVPMTVAPYGREVTVELPGHEVTAIVGVPVETVDHDLLDVPYDERWSDQQDLVAPDGGRLVPLSWRISPGGNGHDGVPDETEPITVRLLAGDHRVALASATVDGTDLAVYDPTSAVVGVPGEIDVDDLAVEVGYDGLTQTADVATGRIVTGAAQPLYDDQRKVTPSCGHHVTCSFAATDPAAPLRPVYDTFPLPRVTLSPYDPALGWADEGSVWAAVSLNLLDADAVVDAAGHYRFVRRASAPVLTLDGATPVHHEGLSASSYVSEGRVVFRVDAGVEPEELVVARTLSLKGRQAPQEVAAQARVALVPVT